MNHIYILMGMMIQKEYVHLSISRIQIGWSISACPLAVVSVTALTAIVRPMKTPLLILGMLVSHTTRTDAFFGVGVTVGACP